MRFLVRIHLEPATGEATLIIIIQRCLERQLGITLARVTELMQKHLQRPGQQRLSCINRPIVKSKHDIDPYYLIDKSTLLRMM